MSTGPKLTRTIQKMYRCVSR